MGELSTLKISFLAGTLGAGGAERQLFYILKTLHEAGAQVRLLAFARGEFWEQSIRELGVPVIPLARTASKFQRLLGLARELRQHPADILQSQHFYTNLYAALIARLFGAREIGAMRNNGRSEVLACGRWGGRCNLRAPRFLAANSRAAIRFATSQGLPTFRLHFLPNVVDTERLRPAQSKACPSPTLLFVGRLEEQKRPERFLSVLAKVRQQRPDAKGVIVGTGRLKNMLEHHAAELHLGPDAVEFRGQVSQMLPVYQEADVCVLTSDHEGTPNVLLEAMAAGLPVVATNVDGVPDIVRDRDTGFLVAPHDEDGMTGALLHLLGDPELRARLGRQARAFVEVEHSLSRLPLFLRGLYERALPSTFRAQDPVCRETSRV